MRGWGVLGINHNPNVLFPQGANTSEARILAGRLFPMGFDPALRMVCTVRMHKLFNKKQYNMLKERKIWNIKRLLKSSKEFEKANNKTTKVKLTNQKLANFPKVTHKDIRTNYRKKHCSRLTNLIDNYSKLINNSISKQKIFKQQIKSVKDAKIDYSLFANTGLINQGPKT